MLVLLVVFRSHWIDVEFVITLCDAFRLSREEQLSKGPKDITCKTLCFVWSCGGKRVLCDHLDSRRCVLRVLGICCCLSFRNFLSLQYLIQGSLASCSRWYQLILSYNLQVIQIQSDLSISLVPRRSAWKIQSDLPHPSLLKRARALPVGLLAILSGFLLLFLILDDVHPAKSIPEKY